MTNPRIGLDAVGRPTVLLASYERLQKANECLLRELETHQRTLERLAEEFERYTDSSNGSWDSAAQRLREEVARGGDASARPGSGNIRTADSTRVAEGGVDDSASPSETSEWPEVHIARVQIGDHSKIGDNFYMCIAFKPDDARARGTEVHRYISAPEEEK